MIQLSPDFKEFLRLLNANQAEYLIVGGYAVAHHGYVRTTADLDIWISVTQKNAEKLVVVLQQFGFAVPELSPALFLEEGRIVRMGVPPIRIEVLTTISGVTFDECYAEREVAVVDGIPVNVISLEHLKTNKQAAGRYKDLADLEHLP